LNCFYRLNEKGTKNRIEIACDYEIKKEDSFRHRKKPMSKKMRSELKFCQCLGENLILFQDDKQKKCLAQNSQM